ncbi:hypothetical protein VNO77_13946 [Canavalia gladiata]|uniref:DUF761 domain-containing protein n=1 Tax=Canavalia gladiata TaxID=3824 RepID=A0AAN9LYG7_CANGL
MVSMNQTTMTADQNGSSLKKGHRSKNIFKVALFMMRGRSRKSKMLPPDQDSKSTWKRLLGSMRPLHLQSTQSPPHNDIPQKIQTSAPSPKGMDYGTDGFESASEQSAYSPSPCSSRYASAVGLNELVKDEEEEEVVEEEKVVVKENGEEGDEIIDAKAEEFIAEFYHQMRLQRLDVTDNHYTEISMRSLGFQS